MMGRGAEGGCGTDVKNCPVSRISVTNTAPDTSISVDVSGADEVPRNNTVDFHVQAKKALAERSPFDEDETKGRVTTLPVAMGLKLAKFEGGRKRVKKVTHAEAGKNVSVSLPPVVQATAVSSIWVETEEYFRDITTDDVDMLTEKMPSLKDPCFLIPVPQSNLDRVNDSFDSGEEESLDAGTSDAVGLVLPCMDETISISAREEVGHTCLLAADQENEKEVTAEFVEDDVNNLESMDIIDNGVCGINDGVVCTLQENLKANENDFSLNWLLSSKHRAFLSSERPNKKRKLLGSDAGLDKLLQLPHLHGEYEDESMCDYCCTYGNASSSDKLLCCDSCKVTVHQKCYGVSNAPIGTWLCSWCKHSETVGDITNGHKDTPSFSCLLCSKLGGALKPVGGDAVVNDGNLKFAHLFCSLWMPEMFVDDIKAMEPVKNFEAIHETRKSMLCYVCKVKHGSCVRCSHGTFH